MNMDIYEVWSAGNRNLKRTTRKLVGAKSRQPQLRERLLHEIMARIDSQEAIREEFVYPVLRITAGREDLMNEYRDRIASIRPRIDELQGMPKDTTDPSFQNSVDVLDGEIDSLAGWEIHEVMPVLRESLSDDEAASYGEQAQTLQERTLHVPR
jgi:hypothetical protein